MIIGGGKAKFRYHDLSQSITLDFRTNISKEENQTDIGKVGRGKELSFSEANRQISIYRMKNNSFIKKDGIMWTSKQGQNSEISIPKNISFIESVDDLFATLKVAKSATGAYRPENWLEVISTYKKMYEYFGKVYDAWVVRIPVGGG